MSSEKTIFEEALGITSPQQRDAYLNRACDDAHTRQAVEALLRAHDRAEGILDSPPADLTSLSAELAPESIAPPIEQPGTLIGPYKLMEQIGEGAMGVVYVAEQLRPVHRRVALKIVKPGLDTKQVIARFEAERQALALMEHPCIAKVFDAGVTESGRSYFVMELVRGIPLTDYCDQNQLPPRARLELFMQVCSAVQHAHTKGIIHRDLKPSNVLVTLNDDPSAPLGAGKPTPKIIDFGIAKATAGQRLTDRTLYTEFRLLIGTPLYMSPEQAEMSAVMDVDTRSDVYSLGVLLYELLTGTTPFDKQRLATAALDEVRRIIREEEPPRPSTRLSTLGATLSTVSMHRQTDPKKLAPIVRGELDWIVMKALEKDRTRRYETANGLAKDVERYLSDQPVEACPPTRMYRMRKFARRNKAAMTTVTLVAAALVLGTAISTWQAIRATRAERGTAEQAAIAQAVSDFLNKDVLGQADVYNQGDRGITPDRDLKVRDALDQASKLIDTRFEGQPLVEAAVNYAIGDAYIALGEYEKAEQHLKNALRLRQELVGDGHADTRECLYKLCALYLESEQHDKAEPLLLQAFQSQRQTLGEQHRDTLRTLSCLGLLYQKTWQISRAEDFLRQALDGQRKVLGNEHQYTLSTLNNLGVLYWQRGQYTRADAIFREVLDVKRRTLGAQHPVTLSTSINLAHLCKDQGRYSEAEKLTLEALENIRRVHGEQHPWTFYALSALSELYREQGRFSEAERLAIDVLERMRALFGAQHARTIEAMQQLGLLYHTQRKYTKAEPILLEALELARKANGEQHPQTLSTMEALGQVYLSRNKYAEAETLLLGVLEQMRKAGRQDRVKEVAVSLHNLGALYGRQGLYDKAEPYLLESIEVHGAILGDQHPGTLTSMRQLGLVYWGRGDFVKAEPLLRQSLEGRCKVLGEQHPNTLEAMQEMAGMYQIQARHADAERLFRQLVETRRRSFPEKARHGALVQLANALVAQGKYAEAESVLRECLDIRQRVLPKNHFHIAVTKSDLACMLSKQGKYEEAEPLLLTAYEELVAQPPPASEAFWTVRALDRIIELYDAWGKPEQAAAWRAKLTPTTTDTSAPETPTTAPTSQPH